MDASARTWKLMAKEYRGILSRGADMVEELFGWHDEDQMKIKELRAEVAQLKEALQGFLQAERVANEYGVDSDECHDALVRATKLAKAALSTPAVEPQAANEQAARALAEYMAAPHDSVEVDTQRMELRSGRQPCGHPTSAIRSTPYIGDQHSGYCGWCLDVTRFECEHQLCQTLTAELLAYREKVARLREALEGILQAEDEAGCSFDEQGNDWPDIEVARAAIGEAAVE